MKMILYHGSKTKFDRFDRSCLQRATKERTCNDVDFMNVSRIGFCFTDNKDFTADYCEEDGYIYTVEAELDEINYDSYEHFLEFLEEYGEDAYEMLINDGYDSVCLNNDYYYEYIILDESKIEIINIEKAEDYGG